MNEEGWAGSPAMVDQPLAPRACSMQEALRLVGERRTLLILRELWYGVHRFEQIRGFTGASRDILSTRLAKLETAHLIERRLYNRHPPRFEYHLTQAGRELHPVFMSLLQWGGKWAVDEPTTLLEHACGHQLTMETKCTHCGQAADLSTVHVVPAAQRQER